jgi:glutathione S-transferase
VAGVPARLITIPISHFCEKARWALDRAGIAYREERHVQGVHQIVSKRAGGTGTVPVLVLDDGSVLAESRDILEHADRAGALLYPENERAEIAQLEAGFDAVLGPEARRWIYLHVLEHRRIGRDYNLTGVPGWERWAFPILFRPMGALIRRRLDIGPDAETQSRRAVMETFDRVAERIDDGRRFLCGDAFTAADLTFAALAAAVVLPEQYGTPLPQPPDLPDPLRKGVQEFRSHPAGTFALRLFAEERR